MKEFYWNNEIIKWSNNKGEKLLKFSGGNTIFHYRNFYYVVKGKTIVEYIVEEDNLMYNRVFTLMSDIQEYIVNEKYIVTVTYGSTLGIYNIIKQKYEFKKSNRMKKVDNLVFLNSTCFLININGILCKVNCITFLIEEVVDIKKLCRSRSIPVIHILRVNASGTIFCECMYYSENDIDGPMERCLIKFSSNGGTVQVSNWGTRWETYNPMQYQENLGQTSILCNDKCYFLDENYEVVSQCTLPYYKKVLDGGGLFPEEEFTVYAKKIYLLNDRKEYLLHFNNSIIIIGQNNQLIQYFYDAKGGLVNDVKIVNSHVVLFTVGQKLLMLKL